jgi:pimeloyl-ACP methyl ester carboxylesterase
VLVHGFGAHGHFWRKWIPHLGRRHRTYAVDLLGFGRAEAPRTGDFSPDAQARLLADLVTSLPGPPPVLAGHSLGAGIVLLAALRMLDDSSASPPRGLLLVSAAAYPQRLPPFLTLARTRGVGALFLLVPPPTWALSWGVRGIVGDGATVSAEQIEGYLAPLRERARRRALLRAARQLDMEPAQRLASRLGEIRLPTLLIWGDRDPVVPIASGMRLARELPDAELVVLPGVGHLPPEEAPEESVGPALRFLASLGARGRETAPGSA